MNSIMERWIQTYRHELLDRTRIWHQRHQLHALREFESYYNEHRPHRALNQAAPLRPLPEPITEPGQITRLEIHRRDRLGGTLHEYQHAAGTGRTIYRHPQPPIGRSSGLYSTGGNTAQDTSLSRSGAPPTNARPSRSRHVEHERPAARKRTFAPTDGRESRWQQIHHRTDRR
ncbi:integrase core domain-containing protein [Saccharopolyspora elongata]|uniref:integrase core domain-containing protein n=1 Tax=Saccharopolyspora elongata TaxID=2530387 RepID=UPI0022A6741A|nr:integrase core domain-containing protein [Saccharopolyspora elongata]